MKSIITTMSTNIISTSFLYNVIITVVVTVVAWVVVPTFFFKFVKEKYFCFENIFLGFLSFLFFLNEKM